MTNDAADIGLYVFKKAADAWRAGRTNSLIDFTRPTRVEPIVLIDADCVYMDELPDVQQSLLSMFTGYYLQAVAIMTNVGNVNVQRTLDKLNPNRDLVENALNAPGLVMAKLENYKERLPHYGAKMKGRALEADTAAPKDALTTAKELSNLSVGKLINVQISDGSGNSATIPVNVRLIASQIPSKTLVHILADDHTDFTATERYHGWRSGRLGFIKDLIFCQDLVEARRKKLALDKDGAYASIAKRASSNAISAILSNEPSVATASNMVVMSTRTAAELEVAQGGKLDNFHSRERMLAPSTIMILAVIDPSMARVTFYHRGISEPTELGVRDLKVSNKSGPDVGDILKAYQIGSAPAF